MIPSKAMMFRSISVMVSAGVPLHQCLGYLAEQEADPELRKFYHTTLQNLESGHTFTASLRASPEDVGALNLALIEIAEHTGSLERVLRRIVEYEVRSEEVRKQLTSQLVYPAFLHALLQATRLAVGILLNCIF